MRDDVFPTPHYPGLGFLVNMSVDIPYDTTYRLGSREPLFMGFGLVEIHREFIEFPTSFSWKDVCGDRDTMMMAKSIPGLGLLTMVDTGMEGAGESERWLRRTFLETISHEQYMVSNNAVTPEAIAEYMREAGIHVENVRVKTIKPTDEAVSMIGEASPGLEPHLGLDFKIVDCPECQGTGKYVGLNVTEFCTTCDGSGKAYVEK